MAKMKIFCGIYFSE